MKLKKMVSLAMALMMAATLAACGGSAPAAAPAPAPAPAPAAEAPDISGLADTIARAIAELGNRPQRDQEIRVYLDGRQLSDAVTRYQRRDSRANGG